ncbi:MAG: PAS domain S-box protein, partial [Chloroflexi bacterium]
ERHLNILQEGWQSPLVEETFLRVDGRPVDVESTGILTTFQGKAVVQSVIRDISSRKRTEAKLRFSDEILKQLPVAVIITDMNGIITRWMGTAEQTFGYTAPEAVGQSIGFIDHPEIVDALQVEITEAIAAGGKYSGEVRCVRKDGVEIPVEVNATVVTDADGTPLGFISINTDVTARKEAEQALRVAETRYKTLVEQLPAIIYIVEFTNTNEPNRTIYISPQVETLLGFSPEEWMADPQLWIQQLHPADREDVLAQVRHYDDAMRGLDIEYRALARDGSVVWFRNNSTMVTEDGARRLAHGIMLDITRQKQLEEQLQQAQKLEAVGQMAGGIAHNFNNVLTALIGHTELALDSLPEDHPVRFDLEGIRKSARRAADLTQQLLAFTRHQVARPQILDLNQLVTDINTMLRQLIDESIEFVVQPGSNLWFIKADSGQIEQVLVNLIVNAHDAMPQGGKLTLSTGNISLRHGQHPEVPGGEYVRLSVTDTGMGIPPEIQPHIFEPFFTTKEVGQGTGLGLSTCFGIVRQNKGYIVFSSRPGEGTTFEIYLPRAQEKTVTVQSIKSLNLNMETGTETVLLVEDAAMVRQMSARVLRQQGFEVIEATNGEEALDILLQEPPPTPHLLITDLTMPKMSGDTLAAKVQELLPSIKILFISGHTNRTLDRMGILARQGAILPKPFTPDTLIKKVRKVLDE